MGDRYRDRYEVAEKIGEGAFAHVFRAREIATGRDVALKVLKEEYSGERDVVERFQREVFAVASVSSPHVVSMLDFGISEGEFFMVMEFVRGPSLRELLVHEPWAPEEVLTVVGQIAHALAAAHQRGIVHRDLKPENVMLVEQKGAWQAKVLDFGFAKLAEMEQTLGLRPITRVGFCFGTPQYLSPEQIRGRETIDGRADLFALGVITYEMIAGKRPWDAREPREVMSAVLKTLPPPALQLHPSLMARLEEVNGFLLRALEKDRDERPVDAVAFFDELQDALYGEARDALAGARPVMRPLEEVTSRSIVVRVTPAMGKQRFDETEIDPPRGSDTVREQAIDTGSIPIFVAERLDSRYLPPVEPVEEVRGEDSRKATLPRGTAQIPKTAPPRRTSRAAMVALALVVVILLAASFIAGRYLKF
jgi:serine/threonine protein kinase